MAMDLRLDQKMSQSLVMSPRMQQAIKILQLNHLEMATHIQDAMLENPTLETVSDGDGPSEAERALQDKAERLDREGTDNADGGGIDWERFLEHMAEGSSAPKGTSGTVLDELPPIEANLTYGESLAEHLLWQIHMLALTDGEREAADWICHNLDHRGYLTATDGEVSEATGVALEDVESAIDILRTLDPIGCCARDLVECLLLQARHHFPDDPTFERILLHHLPNLERKNYGAIARDVGIDLEDVAEYHKMIQELEPQPGRGFNDDEPRYITPDVFVEKHGGDWVVVLNEEGVPDLKVSRYYTKILREASKKDKDYLRERLESAVFLIRSINKRRRTIRRVVESILKFQNDFFDRGAQHLRPLVLQDVASDIGVHMSTVSRVTTNKYIHTPHGIFELKFFFSAAVKQATGDDMAAVAVKSKIKHLVGGEDPRRPLSDQQIADMLKKESCKVARRTVAKYREAMGILSSSQRKQMF